MAIKLFSSEKKFTLKTIVRDETKMFFFFFFSLTFCTRNCHLNYFVLRFSTLAKVMVAQQYGRLIATLFTFGLPYFLRFLVANLMAEKFIRF